MLHLSAGECGFLESGVRAGVRCDGRGLKEARFVLEESGILPQANGSARVRVVGGGGDLLVGVKGEVVVGAEGCGGVEVSGLDGLGEVVEAFWERFGGDGWEWRVFVDVVVLREGGGMVGLAWKGVKAALESAMFPKVRVVGGEVELVGEEEVERVEVDGEVVSIAVIEGMEVVDPTAEEELVASVLLDVGKRKAGGEVCVVRTKKGGKAEAGKGLTVAAVLQGVGKW